MFSEEKGGCKMESALSIINERLLSTGMSQREVDALMGRLLEEEAFGYVSIMADIVKKHLHKTNPENMS